MPRRACKVATELIGSIRRWVFHPQPPDSLPSYLSEDDRDLLAERVRAVRSRPAIA
jgi:hypothetical protein